VQITAEPMILATEVSAVRRCSAFVGLQSHRLPNFWIAGTANCNLRVSRALASVRSVTRLPAQSCFQAFLELFPASLLRVSTALHSRKVLLYRGHGLVMLALPLFEAASAFSHRSLAAPEFLRRSSLLLLSPPFAAPPLIFKSGRGAAPRVLI